MEENEDPCEAVKAPGQEVRERPDLLLYRGELSPLAYSERSERREATLASEL